MTDHRTPSYQPHSHEAGDPGHDSKGSHSWMMIACCIPMLVIALALVATGAVSPGFLIFAGGCILMMTLMMRSMGDMGQGR